MAALLWPAILAASASEIAAIFAKQLTSIHIVAPLIAVKALTVSDHNNPVEASSQG
jgi:hypothetical protein